MTVLRTSSASLRRSTVKFRYGPTARALVTSALGANFPHSSAAITGGAFFIGLARMKQGKA